MVFFRSGRIWIFLCCLWVGGLASAGQWARVRWVDDGDTVVLTDGRRIRYIGINAPEVAHDPQAAQPFGDAARAFNRRLVLNRRVRLEFDREKKDRYKRTLAYVFVENGRLVNASLVDAGYAYCLPRLPNRRYTRVLLAAQRRAMAEKKGIWSRWLDLPGPFLANLHSMRFHRPDCPFARHIANGNQRVFRNARDVFYEGFAPCKRCIPGVGK
jgi:micrococcal nuclease